MLKQIFKPKWQHYNAEVRKEAIEALPPDDTETLLEIALNDPESQLRCLAVRRLRDMEVLENLMNSANNWEVKQLAQQRFQQLFAGVQDESPPLEARLQRLAQVDDLVLLEFLARQGKEPELRLAVLSKVEQDALCGDVAINDPVAGNRLAAVEKITGKPTLERVVEQTRNRDKGVYRIAKDRLDVLIEEEERPKRLYREREALCKRLETLLKANNLDGLGGELENIARQWEAVEGEADPKQTTLFQDLHRQVREAYAEQQALQAQRKARLAVKEQIVEVLDSLWHELEKYEILTQEHDPQALHTALEEHQAAWRLTEALSDAEEEAEWQTRFRQRHTQLQQHLETLQRNAKLQHKLEAVCRDMEKLLKNGAAISKQRPKEFEKRWHSVFPEQGKGEFLRRLRDRFNHNLASLRQRQHEQRERRDEVLKELEATLSELERDLEAGSLHQAEPMESKARKLFQALVDIPPSQLHALEKRLHAAQAQVHELQSWQRWGNKREREQLCESMEALAGSQENPEILAKQVQDLQHEWQHLQEIDHSHALWQRFHKASQAAYAPCKVYFEQRAQERKANQEQRKELCERLEQFIAETFEAAAEDSEVQGEPRRTPAEWKKIHHTTQQLRKEWYAIGPTNRKARKEIEQRYQNAIDRLEQYLEPERERNLRLRRGLVAKAQALETEKELDKAIESAKQLQKEWVITIPASRKDERELWKTFRAAGDAVFARRNEIRDSEQREQEANLQAKTALCEELEHFVQSETDLHSALSRSEHAEEAWNRIGQVPKAALKNLERRFNKAKRRVEEAHAKWQLAQQRASLDLLRDKAELCRRLERCTPEQAASVLEETEPAWQALPALDKAEEQAIRSRFEHAAEAARNGETPVTVAEDVQSEQELLCIRMEIVAGLESPPEAAQARMAYQVERLARAMSGDKDDAEDGGKEEAEAIERAWYLSGPCLEALEQRFEAAKAYFYRTE